MEKYFDDSLPNPYDYESIELDSVTKKDLDTLSKYLVENKQELKTKVRFLNRIDQKMAVDGERWLLGKSPAINSTIDWVDFELIKDPIAYTIIDKGKRVGVVAFHDYRVQWAVWDDSKNYAVRSVMKMLDVLRSKNKVNFDRKEELKVSPWNYNDKGLLVIEALKMSLIKRPIKYGFINNLFWWNKKE